MIISDVVMYHVVSDIDAKINELVKSTQNNKVRKRAIRLLEIKNEFMEKVDIV